MSGRLQGRVANFPELPIGLKLSGRGEAATLEGFMKVCCLESMRSRMNPAMQRAFKDPMSMMMMMIKS
jgi:hypothetical protein